MMYPDTHSALALILSRAHDIAATAESISNCEGTVQSAIDHMRACCDVIPPDTYATEAGARRGVAKVITADAESIKSAAQDILAALNSLGMK